MDEAVQHLREAVRLEPRNAVNLSNLGSILADRRETDAIRVLEMAVAADPAYAPAHFNLARAHLVFERPDLASTVLKYAAILDPQRPDVKNLRTLISGKVSPIENQRRPP
jgi:Flp pilus assembly protein TadD